MIASQNGHVDVVDVLLQHGASVDLQNKVKRSFLHISDYRYDMLRFLKLYRSSTVDNSPGPCCSEP